MFFINFSTQHFPLLSFTMTKVSLFVYLGIFPYIFLLLLTNLYNVLLELKIDIKYLSGSPKMGVADCAKLAVLLSFL